MNILLSSLYHISAYTGGNEQYTHHLATGLIQKGHQVTYLTGSANKQETYPYKVITKPVPHVLGKPTVSIDWLSELAKLKPDIVHCTGSGLGLHFLGYKSRCLSIPGILTYQADTHPVNPLFSKMAQLEHWLTPRVFSAIVTTTPEYEKKLSTRWPHTPVRFIPMMVIPSISKSRKHSVKSSSKVKRILFIGALSSHQYYKGLDVLFSALGKLPDTYKLNVIGTGNLETHYRNLVIKSGLSKKIQFLGFVPDAEIGRHISSSDALVLPSTSDSEGFGLVLIEAMSCKVPTVTTTAIGPASWYKKERVTTMVPPQDPKALARAILEVTSQRDETKIMRAFTFSKQFTVDRMTDLTLKYYQDIIQHA